MEDNDEIKGGRERKIKEGEAAADLKPEQEADGREGFIGLGTLLWGREMAQSHRHPQTKFVNYLIT